MKHRIASGILSVSLVAGGALVGVAIAGDDRADRGSHRSELLRSAPQEVITDGGVSRIFGANRYETATAVSQAYGWDMTNTIAVYIASGADYPDALGIGLSHLHDGPLLLVSQSGIPSTTRAELERLQPCFIDIQGGTAAISDRVFRQLKPYADPTLCSGANGKSG